MYVIYSRLRDKRSTMIIMFFKGMYPYLIPYIYLLLDLFHHGPVSVDLRVGHISAI